MPQSGFILEAKMDMMKNSGHCLNFRASFNQILKNIKHLRL